MLSSIITQQSAQSLAQALGSNKELAGVMSQQAFMGLMKHLLILAAENSAVAFDKSQSDEQRLRAIDRVEMLDEILEFIKNYKETDDDRK